jgi:hypothetical protein
MGETAIEIKHYDFRSRRQREKKRVRPIGHAAKAKLFENTSTAFATAGRLAADLLLQTNVLPYTTGLLLVSTKRLPRFFEERLRYSSR